MVHTVEVRTWLSKYIARFYIQFMNKFPCQGLNVGLADFVWWKSTRGLWQRKVIYVPIAKSYLTERPFYLFIVYILFPGMFPCNWILQRERHCFDVIINFLSRPALTSISQNRLQKCKLLSEHTVCKVMLLYVNWYDTLALRIWFNWDKTSILQLLKYVNEYIFCNKEWNSISVSKEYCGR